MYYQDMALRIAPNHVGALKGLVRNEAGEIHDHVNVYVNSEAIESLDGLGTTLKDGDEVSIIPALAGGTGLPSLGGAGQPSSEAALV